MTTREAISAQKKLLRLGGRVRLGRNEKGSLVLHHDDGNGNQTLIDDPKQVDQLLNVVADERGRPLGIRLADAKRKQEQDDTDHTPPATPDREARSGLGPRPASDTATKRTPPTG